MASGVCTYVRVPRAGRRIAAGSTAYVVRTSYVTYVSPLAWRRWQSNSDRPIDPLNPFFPLPFGHGTGPPPHTTQHLPALRLSCPRSASRDHRRTGTSSASPLIHQQQLLRSDTTRSLTSRARPPGQAHSYRFRPRRSRAGSHTRPRGSYQLAKQLGGCVPWPSTSVPIIPPKAMAEANPNQTATAGAPSHGF